MGETANYHWPLPELTDPPDGPAQLAALGNPIDTTMKAHEPSVYDVTTGFVVQTGWTLSWTYGHVAKAGSIKLCALGIIATRTGAAIVANATGNITDVPVVRIPDAIMPWADWYGLFSTNGVAGTFNINIGTKLLYLVDMYPDASIATGGVVQIRNVYPMP